MCAAYELLCFMFPTAISVRMHPLTSAVSGCRLISSQPPAEICIWRRAENVHETNYQNFYLFSFIFMSFYLLQLPLTVASIS
jgi:hypothetical protein